MGYIGALHPFGDSRTCPTGTVLCTDTPGKTVAGDGLIENHICIPNAGLTDETEILRNCPITSLNIDFETWKIS